MEGDDTFLDKLSSREQGKLIDIFEKSLNKLKNNNTSSLK